MSDDGCPRVRFDLVNTTTGQLVPGRCKTNGCEYCVPLNARLVGLALALAVPERWGRLSLVGDDWPTVRGRMKRLAYRLRKQTDGRWEWAWVVERNPRGTGHHAHFWQHGVYFDQGDLQVLAEREGMGQPWISAWETRGSSIGYGLKSITYGHKAVTGVTTEDSAGFLSINGGRLVHASRGFWRDGAGGARLTLVEARKVAVARCHGADVGSEGWELVWRDTEAA